MGRTDAPAVFNTHRVPNQEQSRVKDAHDSVKWCRGDGNWPEYLSINAVDTARLTKNLNGLCHLGFQEAWLNFLTWALQWPSDSQQNRLSSSWYTSKPTSQDPTLTSSFAYLWRMAALCPMYLHQARWLWPYFVSSSQYCRIVVIQENRCRIRCSVWASHPLMEERSACMHDCMSAIRSCTKLIGSPCIWLVKRLASLDQTEDLHLAWLCLSCLPSACPILAFLFVRCVHTRTSGRLHAACITM